MHVQFSANTVISAGHYTWLRNVTYSFNTAFRTLCQDLLSSRFQQATKRCAQPMHLKPALHGKHTARSSVKAACSQGHKQQQDFHPGALAKAEKAGLGGVRGAICDVDIPIKTHCAAKPLQP